jgi:hypothetical protein
MVKRSARSVGYEPSGVAVELANEEQAIALAERIERKLNRTVIVTDGEWQDDLRRATAA